MTGSLAPWRSRTAARRSRTQWPILLVALTVALVTGSLLSGMSILVSATEEFALRTVLGATPADRTRVDVRTVMSDLRGDVDAAASRSHAAAAELFGPAPHTTSTHVGSALYSVQREDSTPAMTYAAAMENVRDEVDLVAGSWPGAPFEITGEDDDGASVQRTVIPVVAPERILDTFEVALGDQFELRGSYGLGDRVLVQVTGVFAILEPQRPYWNADRMSGAGWRPDAVVPGTNGFLTTDLVGPLLMDRDVITSGLVATELLYTSYSPSLDTITARELPALQSRASRASEEIPRLVTADDVDTVQVATTLTEPLRVSATALTITRSSVLVVGLLLAVLAVAALLQAARLVAEGRSAERSLMRARGGSGRQAVTLGAIEAIGLAVVVGVASPFLARALYLAIAQIPAMHDAGMNRDPGITSQTWLVAALGAAVFAVVLVSPLLRRQGTFVDAEAERARPDRKGFLQRSGLDLAVVALAAVAYWQLQQYASPIVRTAGRLAVDPMLVVGPALVLLAGALLCARVLPPASKLAERVAARGRGATAPLAAWEIGRRPARATSAVLLLTLALAVGTFALTFLSTWRASQVDQAAFAVGADARATSLPGPALGQPALLTGSDGVADVTGVGATLRRDGQLGTMGSRGAIVRPVGVAVLGLDAASRGQLLNSLGGHPQAHTFVSTIGDTATGRLPGIDLPKGTGALELDILLAKSHEPMPGLVTTLRLAVQDAAGLIQTFDVGTLPVTGEPMKVLVDLAGSGEAGDGEAGEGEAGDGGPGAGEAESDGEAGTDSEPDTDGGDGVGTDGVAITDTSRGPLRIVAAQTAWFANPSPEVDAWLAEHGRSTFSLTFTVNAMTAFERMPLADESTTDETATTESTGRTAAEDGVEVEANPDLEWFAKVLDVIPATVTPTDGALLHADLHTQASTIARAPANATQTTWPATLAVPVVASAAAAAQFDRGVGEPLALKVGDAIVPAQITAVVPDIPTVAPGSRAIAADAGLLDRALLEQGAQISGGVEWWLSLEDDSPAALESLTAHVEALGGELTSTRAETVERRDSPLRIGVQAVLWLVVLGASLLAAIGYAVYATVTIRDRALEFARLRAIGLQRRSLLGVVGRESMIVTGLATVFGIGIGVLLGLLVAPVISLSPDGTRPVPEVAVVLPWGQIGLLALEVFLALAVVVAVVSRTLRTADPADVMRAGDAR